MSPLARLSSHDSDGNLQVVVETPRGSALKLQFDPEAGVFRLKRRLALGVRYPYDFGFVPGTQAADGDPLDALVYHEQTSYPGVVITCLAVGVLRLTQTLSDGRRQRNDRLIVVPLGSAAPSDVRSFPDAEREALARFFELAVLGTGKQVRLEGWEGPEEAKRAVHAATR